MRIHDLRLIAVAFDVKCWDVSLSAFARECCCGTGGARLRRAGPRSFARAPVLEANRWQVPTRKFRAPLDGHASGQNLQVKRVQPTRSAASRHWPNDRA